MREVVEDDPRAGNHDERVRERDVGRRLGPDALEHACGVVGEGADRAARERKARPLDAITSDDGADAIEHRGIAVDRDGLEVVEPQERVARDAVRAFDRLEQTRTPRRSQGEVGGYRGQRVRYELTHDRRKL